MGRKKQYSDHAERSRAFRQRKQSKPSKLSNQEKMVIAKTEFAKLKNPSRADLIYSLCISQNWSRTLSTEVTNMLELSENIKFTEKTEPTKPESEFEEWKIIGQNPDNKRVWDEMSDSDKEFLREWYAYVNSPEVVERRRKTEETLNVFYPWLQQKHGLDKMHWENFTRYEERRYVIEAQFYTEYPKLPKVALCGEYPPNHPLLKQFI